MIIELIRAHTPEDYGDEGTCGICEEQFTVEAVFAQAVSEDRDDLGVACPECVALMGRYKPEKFPTIEEYEAALRRFPGPIWANTEEATRAWREGDPHQAALEASRIRRQLPPGGAAAHRGAMEALDRSDAFRIAGEIIGRVPDARFGHPGREDIARVLADAAHEAGEELSRYRRAFGIPSPSWQPRCAAEGPESQA